MNWIVRLGLWWESRRTVSHLEFRKALERLQSEVKPPQEVLKEFALINHRLNQVELFVGLKRDPKPEHVPGAPKIQ